MKPKNLYQWLIVIFSVMILVACGKNNHPNRSPSPPPSRYPDRPIVVIFGDGSKNSPGNLPPGQAKKIYGHKSAKAFAPGQQKKYRDRYGRVPPIVISIPDSRGKRDGSGKWYYQDEDSFIYWKYSDGYYHIDDKYFNEDGDTREAKKSEDYDERTNGNGKGNGNGNGKVKGKGKN